MRFWIGWALGLAAWIAALIVAALWDLAISRALVDPQGFAAWFVRFFGELPGWAFVGLSLWAVLVGRRPRSAFGPYRRAGAAVLIQAVALPLFVTQLLKVLWGRVRFSHLPADLAGHTPFYVPAGPGAGQSFPSGHVAMAVVMAPLPFFLWYRGRRRAALLVGAAVAAWGLFVSWGRIRAGAHFATDCLFSFGLAWLVGALLGRWAALPAQADRAA